LCLEFQAHSVIPPKVRHFGADVCWDGSEFLRTMAAGVDNQVNGFAELASLLWQERAARERILFKIVEEQLVAAAGRTRFLASAGQEIEAAVDDLRRGEAVRATEAAALAERLGLPASVTLVQIAGAAPEPWGEILRAHCDALREIAGEIDEATGESRRLLDAVTSVRGPRPSFARLRSWALAPMAGEASR